MGCKAFVDGAGSNSTVEGFGRKKRLLSALIASTILGTASLYVPAIGHAQQQPAGQTVNFNIPAQPLGSAINAFIRQTGWEVGFNSPTVVGKRSTAVSGSMSPAHALQTLLAGTGLHAQVSGPSTAALVPSVDRVAAAHDVTDGSLLLDTITVAGGTGAFSPDTPYETAGSSTYISGEKIERFRGTSVGDMLSGTPGVLNADNRNGAALDVNIRGMQGQGRVPVIVDGAQQETTVWRGYSGIVGRSYVDPDFIGEVMVEKGPSSAADGAGIIGGAVRMNTITVDDILLPEKNFGVRLKGGFNSNSSSAPPVGTKGGLSDGGVYPTTSLPSSFGGPDGMDRPGFLEPTGGNGSIAAGYRSEYVDLVAAFARRKNGNYHAGTHGDVAKPDIYSDCGYAGGNPTQCVYPLPGSSYVVFEGLNRFRAGEEVLNSSQDNTSALLKATVRLPHDQQINLSYMRYESNYGEIMPSQILWSDGYGAYQAWLNSVTMDTYTAKYKWNPSDNDLVNLKAGLWMTDTEQVIPGQYFSTEQTPPEAAANLYGTGNRRWGLNVENTSSFETALGGLSLNYGGSFTYETIRRGNGADLITQREGKRRELSLSAAAAYKPTDWLTLNASLRYSDYRSEDKKPWTERTYPFQHGDRIINFSSDIERLYYWFANMDGVILPDIVTTHDGQIFTGNGLAPMISATVEPWDGIQFYGKYAEAIRLPSLFETTKGWSTDLNVSPGAGFGLRPEHAKTWELGFNVLRNDVLVGGDSLRFKANYFDNKVDDYITRTFTAGFQAPIVNIDHAVLRGIELQTSYDMGKFFGDLAYTHYTHTEFCSRPENVWNTGRIELCNPGGTQNSYVVNQLPPKDSLSVTLGMRAFDEKLTLGGRLTYIGKRSVGGVLNENENSGGGSIEHVAWKPYTLVDLFASYKVNENFQIDAAIDNVTDTYYMDTLTLGLMASPGRTFRMNMTAKF